MFFQYGCRLRTLCPQTDLKVISDHLDNFFVTLKFLNVPITGILKKKIMRGSKPVWKHLFLWCHVNDRKSGKPIKIRMKAFGSHFLVTRCNSIYGTLAEIGGRLAPGWLDHDRGHWHSSPSGFSSLHTKVILVTTILWHLKCHTDLLNANDGIRCLHMRVCVCVFASVCLLVCVCACWSGSPEDWLISSLR